MKARFHIFSLLVLVLFISCSMNNNDDTIDRDIKALSFDLKSTGLPIVYITTPNKVPITSKEDWLEGATISITDAKEENWNLEITETSIRGRGNSTWAHPKKPYAIKLDKKQSILGMPKHKRWVLIANYHDNTFMRNSIAFYLSEKFEMDWTVHGKFVNLIFNGKYQGLYWFGEAIKVDKNRVDISEPDKNTLITDNDDYDYLIEIDTHYDEPWKFKSSIRNLPYMIKNDDYMADSRLQRLNEKINNLEKLLYPNYSNTMTSTNQCSKPNKLYTDYLDIESWAKYWIINELMNNKELKNPKSTYFTFDSSNNILKAGPAWDFDTYWAENNISSCKLTQSLYYNALFKSETFKNEVKRVWEQYAGTINIQNIIMELKNEINSAAQYDVEYWGINHTDPLGVKCENFDAYVDFLQNFLITKYNIVDNYILSL